MEPKESDLSGWRFVLEDDKKLHWTGRAVTTRHSRCLESERISGHQGA